MNRHDEVEDRDSRGAAAYLAACEESGIHPIFSGKQEPQAIKAKPVQANTNDAEKKLVEGIRALVGSPAIDEGRIREIVKEEGDKALSEGIENLKALVNSGPAPIQIHLKDRPEPATIDGAHAMLPTTLDKLHKHGKALLHGPTGTGKSFMFYQLAEAMGYEDRETFLVSCTSETSIYDLLGARDADGNYWEGPLLKAFERGGIILIDEFDALDPSVQVALNAALDSLGKCPVPLRDSKPVARKHERFIPILSMNTLAGATHEYTGRGGKPDAASMARFPWATRVHVDYDRDIEKRILSGNPALADMLWALREAGREQSWDQDYIPTTRDFEALAIENESATKCINMHMSQWPEEMRSKAKEVVKATTTF